MNDELDELKEKLGELSEKLDDITDNIESTVENAVQDSIEDAVANAVQDSIEDAVGGIGGEEKTTMYILSQDKKLFAPFTYIEAVRIKKGEEPYAINLSLRNCIGRRIGKYENKAAALAEMQNIVNAFRGGVAVYEVK